MYLAIFLYWLTILLLFYYFIMLTTRPLQIITNIRRWTRNIFRFPKWRNAATPMTFATTLATRTRRNAIWNSKDACIDIVIRIRPPASASLTRVKLRPRSSSRERSRWVAKASSMLRNRPASVPTNGRPKTRGRKRRRQAGIYNAYII